MALKYDYTNIAALDSQRGISEQEHHTISMFAWQLMAIDVQEVTEKNVEEVVFRLHFLNKLGYGSLFKQPSGQKDVEDKMSSSYVAAKHFDKPNPEELRKYIRSMIGYKTNVLTQSRAKFVRRWVKAFERDALADI
jgi:hypothetical protein|tara:strand:- start:271 stop:678 length:408 start_codon:yes stop_codon:yes gene_type:complete